MYCPYSITLLHKIESSKIILGTTFAENWPVTLHLCGLDMLKNQDLAWMAFHGARRDLPQGAVLVEPGIPLKAIYVILTGEFAVSGSSAHKISKLGPGQIVGEVARTAPPRPSVIIRAAPVGAVLAVDRAILMEKLRSDGGMATRFREASTVCRTHRARIALDRLNEVLGETGESASAAPRAIGADTTTRLLRLLKMLDLAA